MNSEEKGVLFIGVGYKYAMEAIGAASRLKSLSDLSIALVTDQSIESENIDYFIKAKENKDGTRLKIENMEKTPFEKTLFLDTDIFVEKKWKNYTMF
jgi:hypothetical protein